MAEGLRNAYDPDFDLLGDFGDAFSGDSFMDSVPARRRRKKSRKNRRAPSKSHSKARTRSRSSKGSKSSKRPYPHWLKKYWFKKKR